VTRCVKRPQLASQTHQTRPQTKAETNHRKRGPTKSYWQTGQGLARSISEAGRGTLSLRSVVPNTRKEDYDGNGTVATARRSIDALAPYRSPVHRHLSSRDDTDINKRVRLSTTRPVVATALNRNTATKASAKSVSSAQTAGSGVSAKPFSHLHFDSAASKPTRVDGDIYARSENSRPRLMTPSSKTTVVDRSIHT
jgi:hypothetical protein